ncbi:MAG: sulfur carrier protein ThiS [Zoogloeaceae bacterium]|jgi:sulfur carrier protein|nr:sulfur carrier protein ThiS [Zoogloeaceae bacterium]
MSAAPPVFTLNGSVRSLPAAGLSVAALLLELGYADKRLAVELNGAIVPKSQHAETAIAAGDTLEIVIAVGGG